MKDDGRVVRARARALALALVIAAIVGTALGMPLWAGLPLVLSGVSLYALTLA